MQALEAFLESKGAEYAPFDPARAPKLLAKLGLKFSNNQSIIQVIGTNGKGSTGRFLALMLKMLGVKVGHFTSPHLLCLNERFWINGANISDSALNVAFLELNHETLKEASYFEVLTFLAFRVFRDCEVVILEAGLGGEYDSTTTCVKADITLFTSIGIDHQEYLGDTLEKIATTKLNAMAKHAILGFQSEDCIEGIAKGIAKAKGAHLEILKEIPQEIQDYVTKNYPSYQGKNLSLAWAGLLMLNKIRPLPNFELGNVSLDSALSAFLKDLPALDLQGRMQKLAHNIYLDVAHNTDGAKALMESLKKMNFIKDKYILIYNSYFDKNPKAILTLLKPIIVQVQILPLQNPRVIAKPMLEDILQELGIAYCDFGEIREDSQYLVCGSFSVVGKFLELYKNGIENEK